MRKRPNIIIAGIAFSVLLIAGNLSSGTTELNRLFDITTVLSDNYIIYSFKLSKKPYFSIKPSDEKTLSILFLNTDKTDEPETIIEKTPFIYADKEVNTNSSGFILAPDNPYGKIECTWIKEKSVFAVYIELNPGIESNTGKSDKPTLIKDIRFGYKENATRMAIGALDKPRWSIVYPDSNNMLLKLEASSENIKTKSYVPEKWLHQVEIIGMDNKHTEISMNLESEPDQTGIFWLPVGNRLVLDIQKNPDDRILALLYGKNPDGNNKIKAVKNVDDDFRNIVRMKINKDEILPSSLSDNDIKGMGLAAVAPEMYTEIKSLHNNSLPDGSDINVDIEKLSPEEAFLYGRIRQAKEINDYDMGIMLTNQFLKDYKKSYLCEAVSFWRGDFYYNKWEKMDNADGEMVINAYKYAIDKFENSRNIPLAYIKMSKVASGMDDGYQALGYLSIVLSSKNPDFMPLAYLARGKVFLQIEQPEKAIKDFKVLLQEYPDSRYAMEANLWIASYYHRIGLYEESEQRLSEINEKHPELYLEYPEVILLNAKNGLYLKKYAEARNHLFKAINIGGQQEAIDLLLSRIGDTYHNEENDKEAEKYYRMVIDYYPASEGASISKLRLAEYFSDITLLDNVSQNESNETIGELALLEKAYQLYENKEYTEAIKTLKETALKPVQTETRKDAKRLIVHAIEKELDRLKEAGLPTDLVYIYKDNEEILTDRINPESLLLVAEAYKKLDRYKEAVLIYSLINSYDLGPDAYVNYLQGLTESYISMGETDKAISFLEKGKNGKMKQGEIQKLNLLLAGMYLLKERHRDAENLYNLVLQDINGLSPEETVQAYLNLGITFKAQKKFSEARNAINHSIEMGLNNNTDTGTLRSAYIELGNVLYAEGRYHHAARAFEKGFSLEDDSESPGYWEIRFKQAMSYLNTGEMSKAETLLNDISEGGEDSFLQQRAQLKLGSLMLSKQLKFLSIGEN